MAGKHFRIKRYGDKNRPNLKFVVRSNVAGKWERRFFETLAEAKTYAAQKEIALLNQGTEGMKFPTELRVMAQRATEQLKPFGKTIAEAAQFYVKYLAAESRSIPVGQAAQELIANRRDAGFSRRYCEDLKSRLGRFAKTFAQRTASTITTKEIEAWLESLGVEAVTRNTYRRDCRTLFSSCTKRNYCAENPATSVTRAKEPSREVEVLTVEDTRLLLAASSPALLPYWAIGLFAGLRSSEILHLHWADIDFGDCLMTVRSAKTGRKRFVKMHPNLLAWLAPYRMKAGAVVPSVNFRQKTDEDKAAAGLGGRWPANAARHSFGSYWLAQFNDINALALQMGNSPQVIEKHYKRAVRPKEAHRYWDIMPSADAQKKVVAFAAQ